MISGNFWQLQVGVNGYGDSQGKSLVTQVKAGRSFECLDFFNLEDLHTPSASRLKVRLLEDGYICWIDWEAVLGHAFLRGPWEPNLLSPIQIKERLPAVLLWVANVAARENKYLWGGTLGPDFDCSGLVQAAFASQRIWLPRDAYQQEQFCEKVPVSRSNYHLLRLGDLLFFGSPQRCDHVAIYKGSGLYWHSSGITDGRNGIGCDGLYLTDTSPIACRYRSRLRGAGRISFCHDGRTLP